MTTIFKKILLHFMIAFTIIAVKVILSNDFWRDFIMNKDLKGLYAALLVVFDENGQVNEQGLKQIAQNAIETEELDGLYVNGSLGAKLFIKYRAEEASFQSCQRGSWG